MRALGFFITLLPLFVFILMYLEGGLMAVIMYFLYIFATLSTLLCSYIGIRMMKKKSL